MSRDSLDLFSSIESVRIMQSQNEEDERKLAEFAFYQATLDAIERARQTGTPVVIWKDGRVQHVPPDEMVLPPPPPGFVPAKTPPFDPIRD